MKLKNALLLISILILVLLIDDRPSFSAEANKQKRIKFQIVTVEEKQNQRNILSQTTIEGLEGTDFNVNLQTGNFKMQARFLSDLVEGGKLKIRAKLNTRRFYGYSPVNLPLYEEDTQNQSMLLGFDETIVLLPFGRNGGEENLKIEITPTLLSDVSANLADKLKINIDKPLQSGELFVEASKIPHNFEVEAVLLSDGQEIARGMKKVLFEEEEEIVLMPNEKAGAEISDKVLTTKFTVSKFTRSRPQDLVSFYYKVYRGQGSSNDQSQTRILEGAGVMELGSQSIYQLDKTQLPGDKKYELKFNVRLAEVERSE
jgi:hypothetical protein